MESIDLLVSISALFGLVSSLSNNFPSEKFLMGIFHVVTMDSWSDKQVAFMRAGGNNKCNEFLQKYGVEKATPIDKKYNSAAAAFYRKMIAAEVEGTEVPTPPESFGNEGGGSDEDYVQKELKAREEARERLRQKFGHSAGLSSSGGVMQGIGSDSSYQPGPKDSNSSFIPGGLPAVDVDKLADASRTAFTFLSASLSTLGDSVLKVQSFCFLFYFRNNNFVLCSDCDITD